VLSLLSQYVTTDRPETVTRHFRTGPLAVLACMAALAGLVGGCRPDSAPQELETMEVTGPLDADLSFDEDTQAVQRAPELSGVLPSDFPADFPVYLPASVVDFGELGAGRYYAVLFTPDDRRKVDRFVHAEAPRAAWSLRSAEQDAGRSVFSKGGRTMKVEVKAAKGGTELHVEY